MMECDETFWVNSYTNISLLYDSLSLIQEQKKNITLCYLFTKKLTHYYEILLLSNFHTKKWCEILSELKKSVEYQYDLLSKYENVNHHSWKTD